jgi:hypothetical protein
MTGPMIQAFRAWMQAIETNTGQRPSQVYVDMRTNATLMLEVVDDWHQRGAPTPEKPPRGVIIDGIRVSAIDTE